MQDTAIGERMNNTVSVQAHWAILIEVYSTMSLTFPGDKLIAISRGAKKYRHETNDEYVAGMWRKDLANWILWYVRQWPSPRPLVYRAPTWSWASVDNVIGTQRGNLIGMIATVDDFVLRYATEDNTGATTDGWLDLTGPLKPIRFVRRQLEYYLSISNTLDSSQDVRGLENTWKEQGPRLLFDEPPQDELLQRDAEQGPLLFCMICRVLHSTPIPLVVALLVRLEDAKKKTFTRFGLAVALDMPTRAILLADIDEDTRKSLPCLRYDNGLHTIRII